MLDMDGAPYKTTISLEMEISALSRSIQSPATKLLSIYKRNSSQFITITNILLHLIPCMYVVIYEV